MKCTNCSYDNLPHSEFCQECGSPLKNHSTGKSKPHEKTLREEIEKIDDVIFKPKEQGSFIGNIIKLFFAIAGIGFIGIVVLIFLGALFSDSDTSTPDTVATSQSDLTIFPVGYLEIKDLDSEWVGQQFYVKGVLKNSYSSPAQNVRVRVDFYKDNNQQQLFDTRYMTLLGVSANGAYSFDEPVYINPYDGQFWYVTQIESAEYLK